MVKLKSHKTGKYLCNWSNKCNGKDASFLLKTGWSCDINRLSLIFKWSSELLETSTWKSSKETGCLQISVWSAYNHSYICLKKKLYLIKIKLFCLSIETTFLYLFEKKLKQILMLFLKNYFCKSLHLRFVLQGFWIHPPFVYVIAKLNKSFMMCVAEVWIHIFFLKN